MIERLAKQLAADLNSLLQSEPVDNPKLKALLEAALRKLNLVSREEFDAQSAVLQRTRERLHALEAQLAELEALAEKNSRDI